MPKELQYVLLTLGTEMYCRLCVLLYMYIVKTITTIYYCKTCIINKTSRNVECKAQYVVPRQTGANKNSTQVKKREFST